MTTPETLAQARYILVTGKMIRDRLDRIIIKHIRSNQSHLLGEDLSLAQMYAVLTIRDQGQVSITELSEILNVSAPSASNMVERLVEKQILDRKPSQQDRRRMVVTIATQAKREIEAMEALVTASFVEIIEKIGPDLTRKWRQVLDKISEVID